MKLISECRSEKKCSGLSPLLQLGFAGYIVLRSLTTAHAEVAILTCSQVHILLLFPSLPHLRHSRSYDFFVLIRITAVNRACNIITVGLLACALCGVQTNEQTSRSYGSLTSPSVSGFSLHFLNSVWLNKKINIVLHTQALY